MNRQREQFDSNLAEALSSGDVVAALDELSRRYADDAQTCERIRESRQLVSDLISMGERLADEPAPAIPKLYLRAWRIRPRWIAVPAAAVAAAVILAMVLSDPTVQIKPKDNQQQVVVVEPVESVWLAAISGAADFTIPAMNNPPCPSLEMPAITTPTVCGFSNTEFSIPAFTWPEIAQRSTNNET
ncbi:MAG: hypothetical protein KAV00_06345 [Phycisphaerae bacterium]|nr:hypothetical protein [Phycisphaerae bacterium]